MIDLSKARILCVGDIMLDRFVAGSVDRISPEAPVPVFRWGSEREMLGGVGNVVASLRALGAKAGVACRVGRDREGESVKRLLDESGSLAIVMASDHVPTIQKTRFVAQGHHVLRMDRETVAPLTADEEKRLFITIAGVIGEVDIVLLSDYAKGLLSRSFCERLIALARESGKRVYVDPKGKDYRKYAGATLVKPNRKELEAVCGVALDPKSSNFLGDVEKYARKLLETVSIDHAIVTLSEKGMLYVPREAGETIYLPTECREVCDVSGAGDTTIATLAAARAAGASFREAMEIANVAAGIVVGKVGTATVSADELRAVLAAKNGAAAKTGAAAGSGGKVFAREALAVQVKAWQTAGFRVGFTNGCFDCLHRGHLSSLVQAKAHCDKLVVAVNTDASVKRLKGPKRPIQDEATRTQLLAALETVDAVTLFDEETALPLVEAIRPDVIAKEGYTIDRWPEARFVVSYGGEAVTLERVDGYSTSALAERMKNAGT